MMTRPLLKMALALLAVVVNSVLSMGLAQAQADPCGLDRDATAKALDELTWKQINAIYEDVSEARFDDAYDDLQKMLRRAGRDVYLQAILNQALAQVEWSRQNFQSALGYFEQAVELDSLPDRAHFALMYQIAQLYFMQQRLDEALERLDLWLCKAPDKQITAAAYVLQASIYAGKEDYTGVLKAISTAIAMDEEPREPWYQLQLAAHYELEQYQQAAKTLEVLVSNWPGRKMYWTQLSQVYYKLKQDDKALAVLALAYRNKLLDSQADILFLTSLYNNSGVPFKAAEVMENGIRDGVVESTKQHWTVVADTWYAAEELERSLLAYEEAGQVAGDGVTDLRRGFILVDLERWSDALESLDLALQKGGLDERMTGEAYLLRGMAHFNLGNFDAASADWGKAGRHEKSREAARQWMNHLRERRQGVAP